MTESRVAAATHYRRTLAIALVMATALGVLASGSKTAATASPIGYENPQFLYQKLPPSHGVTEFGLPSAVIVGARVANRDPAALAARIHAGGSKAFAYVQGLWLPAGLDYFGISIDRHLDWALCAAGSQPTVGRVVNEPRTGVNRPWLLVDTNERAARDAFIAWFVRLRAAGFDGVFFDRGGATLRPGFQFPDGRHAYNAQSTCTQEPVLPAATIADSYVNLMRAARRSGLAVMLNYGPISATNLRSDAFTMVESVLDESTDYPMAPEHITALLESHRGGAATGKLVSYLKDASNGETARRDAIFFKWARAKLIPHPVAVMSGEDRCGGLIREDAPCWRQGFYPELNGTALGPAFSEDNLVRTNCDPGSTTHCVFLRRYGRGIVIVNNSLTTKGTGPVSLNLRACRFLFNVYRQRPAGEACVDGVDFRLPPMSGRVYRYSSTFDGLESYRTAP